jgi:hypothetical protein
MRQVEQSPLSDAKPEKSKWLSSFVWIVVLWLFVRLIAELDGISWTRAYWSIALNFGALPATFFLFLSIGFFGFGCSKFFRWAALLTVVGSFVGSLVIYGILKNGKETDFLIMLFQVGISILVVLVALLRNWWVRKSEVTNG